MTTPAIRKSATTGTNVAHAKALPPPQARAYAQKLIGADVAGEKKRVTAVRTEAKSEPGAKAARLVAASNERLKLIAIEESERKLVSDARLTEFAASLQEVKQPDLVKQVAALRAKILAGTAGANAPVRLLAMTREEDRRESVTAQKKIAAERVRLNEVKTAYETTLAGDSNPSLKQEQKAEHVRLDSAQSALLTAREQLAGASNPAERAAAQMVVAGAERNLRTEYAKAAVIDAHAPVELNHQQLHNSTTTRTR